MPGDADETTMTDTVGMPIENVEVIRRNFHPERLGRLDATIALKSLDAFKHTVEYRMAWPIPRQLLLRH